tara:strand:- start:119 stop:331 length:213 start_codon:yes stop_codon:yes gene_type:complete
MAREVYMCVECGSEDIQVAMWVNPNTGESDDWYGSGSSAETQWCHNCEEHCFVKLRVYPDEQHKKVVNHG